MDPTNTEPEENSTLSPFSDGVFRDLFHSVNDAIFIHDAETGEILDVNETMCDMYGYTRAEARELSIEDLSSGVPPYTQETAVDYVQKAADGDPQVFDWQAEDNEGHRFWVEVSMRRATVDDETLILVIVRDITERKTHEQALEHLHETTRDLLAATSPDEIASITCDSATEVLGLPLIGVHLYDADTDALVPVAWSDAVASVLDGSPPSIPSGEGLAWQAYVNNEAQLYADVREVRDVLDEDTPFRSELHLPLGEHGVIIIGSTTPNDFDPTDATLAHILATNVEAALDRVERERELAEERTKYETVIERSHDGIVIIQDGRFVFTNPRGLDILGYEEGELIGKPLVDIIAPDEKERVRDRYERRTDPNAESPPSRYETRIQTSEGETRITEISASPIQYEGEPADLVIVRDVTERKHYEEQLEATTEELEALNRVVRHDIRNDMAIILGWAELLDDHVDEDGQEFLRKILTSGEHIVELTDTARDYIETLTSEDDLAVTPTPLRSVLETELDLRRESFPEAEFVLSGDVPDVEVTANEMLGSVFRNLLNNAVQHNDKGTPVVTVSCEVDGEDVVVRIADNGPGIPDAQTDSIFEKGNKGIESSGSGIGLYLVRTLVKQYNGTVEIEDNEPEGAVFIVRLPKAD
jgi:PAS domain S-box-containing protein